MAPGIRVIAGQGYAMHRISCLMFIMAEYLATAEPLAPKRFKVPSMHIPWASLSSLRTAPYGMCWILCTECMNESQLVGLFDDSNEAYRYLKVGESEAACSSRAMYYWHYCGNGAHQPILAYFASSKIVASYPPDDVVDDFRSRMNTMFTGYNSNVIKELKVAGTPPRYRTPLSEVSDSCRFRAKTPRTAGS